MQLFSCQNSSEFNGNYQNSMLTLATGMMMLSCMCYCGRLLYYRWFSTPSLSKVETDLLKRQSALSYFEQTLGLMCTCGW
jgi:hypothetical protein